MRARGRDEGNGHHRAVKIIAIILGQLREWLHRSHCRHQRVVYSWPVS